MSKIGPNQAIHFRNLKSWCPIQGIIQGLRSYLKQTKIFGTIISNLHPHNISNFGSLNMECVMVVGENGYTVCERIQCSRRLCSQGCHQDGQLLVRRGKEEIYSLWYYFIFWNRQVSFVDPSQFCCCFVFLISVCVLSTCDQVLCC